jgi:hypothetical protein
LFDQSQPFGRLALVHAIQAAGSALITVSLAGSLFFSISPSAAKYKVLLYLLLTIAPFAIVGPALSPLLDRGRQARRTSVAIANAGSALLCLGMARNIHNLFLFPEAFGVLVLGKLYIVAKASIVPDVIGQGDDLASRNAMLAVIASLAGFAAIPFGIAFLQIGAASVLVLGSCVFFIGTFASLRLPRPRYARAPSSGSDATGAPAGAMAATNARLGEVAAERRRLGLPLYRGEVLQAISAVSIARASVGFVEFFLAFGLKRAHAATWWYGVLIVASGAGALCGSMLVPRLRRYLSEAQIIASALLAIALGATGAAILGGLWAQVMLTFVVGVGPTSAKPALDSLVQRHVPPALLGRTFGRMETRLQLVWVLASLFAVLIPFAFRPGDIVVATGCALGGFAFASAHVTRRRHRLQRRAALVAQRGERS